MSQGPSNSPNQPTPPDRGQADESNTPKDFLACLQRSKILSKQQLIDSLTKLKNQQPALKRTAKDVANFFIAQGHITEWQSKKLLRGRYKGFFLDKYQLLDHLGTGGMSTVYLAEHSLTGQKRAIKVLPRDKISERSYLSRFYREARSVAALNHPNIVRIYDVANEDQTHYMVMEYAQGMDLFDLVTKKGKIEFDLARDCIRQAALGLSHAHQNNFVHRDIKPANLLLNLNKQLKILDLGLALLRTDTNQFGLSVRHNEQMMGTADYLAPEQAVNSHEVDHRADIYSLGCTLYYLLTAQPPFPEGSLAQRISAHQTKKPQPITELRPDCPDELVSICNKMIRKNPDDRFQSCEELIAALDGEFVPIPPTDKAKSTDTEEQSKPSPPEDSKQKKMKSMLPMFVSLGGLVLFVFTLAVLLIIRSWTPSSKNGTAASTQSTDNTSSISKPQTAVSQPAPAPRKPSTNQAATNQSKPAPPPKNKTSIKSGDNQKSTSSHVLDFEDSSRFPSRRDEWDIKIGNNIIGTLRNRGKAKVTDAPAVAAGNIQGKCLLLVGDSTKVEFRPLDRETQIRSVQFDAIRQSNGASFGFSLEAKSKNPYDKWRMLYLAKEDLNKKQPVQIVIEPDIFNTIDAWKFRFRVGGVAAEGVFIDNLKIELR